MEIETLTTPQAIETKAEYAAIMTDPKHPMHAGYLAKDKKVDEYINAMYAKLIPTAPPVTESLTLTSDMSADAPASPLSQADQDDLEDLKTEWAEHAEARFAEAQVGVRHLQAKFGKEAVDDLTEAVIAAGGDLKFIVKIAQFLGHKANPYVS